MPTSRVVCTSLLQSIGFEAQDDNFQIYLTKHASIRLRAQSRWNQNPLSHTVLDFGLASCDQSTNYSIRPEPNPAYVTSKKQLEYRAERGKRKGWIGMAIQQVLMDNDDPALCRRIFQPAGRFCSKGCKRNKKNEASMVELLHHTIVSRCRPCRGPSVSAQVLRTWMKDFRFGHTTQGGERKCLVVRRVLLQ